MPDKETGVPDEETGVGLFDNDDVDTGEDAPETTDFTDEELEAILAARTAAGPDVADGEAS
jgi:hypothetical protein